MEGMPIVVMGVPAGGSGARKNLLQKLADGSGGTTRTSYEERAEESEVHIERIRAMLKAGSEGDSQAAQGVSALQAPAPRSSR